MSLYRLPKLIDLLVIQEYGASGGESKQPVAGAIH
jgi:hypothetical protein